MRSVPWRIALVLAPVLAVTALVVGCNNPQTSEEKGGGGAGKEPVVKRGEMKEFEAKGTGTLKGKATLDGALPEQAIADKNKALLAAIDKHQDKEQCLAGSESEKTEQEWRVKDGAVQNVVVWVLPPKDHYFKIDPSSLNLKTVEVDQPHCAFIPHVSVAFASYYDPKTKKQAPTGQKIEVKNNAKMNHNTKWDGGPNNPGANPMIPPGKDITLDVTADDSRPISLSCSIHTWMNGYIWALNTPYAAVTNEKGEYEIKNVPAGADLQLYVWHEPNEWVAKGEKITIKEGDNEKDFKVKPEVK